MAFGLKGAPSSFQQLMNVVLRGLLFKSCIAYLDDIIVFSRSFEDHLLHLRQVFERLQTHGLTCKPEKCVFGRASMKFLGHIVGREGISPDPAMVKTIPSYPIPRNVKDIQRFMGMCNWYGPFVENFSYVAEPLNQLRRRNMTWAWTNEADAAFTTLKEALGAMKKLHYPNFANQFVLQTDASDVGLGAVLYQVEDEMKKIVAFASRALSQTERMYHTTERECLAVVWAIKKFRPYLESKRFKLVTDHNSLRWLQTIKDSNSKLARWAILLQEFDFDVEHCSGANNQMADALSRAPLQPNRLDEAILEEYDRMVPPHSVAMVSAQVPSTKPNEELIPFQKGELQDAQRQDEELGPVFQYLVTGVLPRDAKARRKVVRATREYVIQDGLLVDHSEKLVSRVVVPGSLREKVLRFCHDSMVAGHLGRTKTWHRVHLRFTWRGMRKEVDTYVKSCPVCQRIKADNQKPAGLLMSNLASGRWVQVALDLMGPFPCSRRGNVYLLVVTDQFSKWIELFPLRKATSENVWKRVEAEVICR